MSYSWTGSTHISPLDGSICLLQLIFRCPALFFLRAQQLKRVLIICHNDSVSAGLHWIHNCCLMQFECKLLPYICVRYVFPSNLDGPTPPSTHRSQHHVAIGHRWPGGGAHSQGAALLLAALWEAGGRGGQAEGRPALHALSHHCQLRGDCFLRRAQGQPVDQPANFLRS